MTKGLSLLDQIMSLKHLARKINSIINQRFNVSSIILKTEVVNANVKVIIYELSLKRIVFQYAWII